MTIYGLAMSGKEVIMVREAMATPVALRGLHPSRRRKVAPRCSPEPAQPSHSQGNQMPLLNSLKG